MIREVSLDLLVLQELGGEKKFPHGSMILLDTNSFKYRLRQDNVHYPVAVTPNVSAELSDNLGTFSEEHVSRLGIDLNLDLVFPIVEEHYEVLIRLAASSTHKRLRKEVIESFDVFVVAEALKRAMINGKAAITDGSKPIGNVTKLHPGRYLVSVHEQDGSGDIGMVDTELMSYAMGRANNGLRTLIISDDGDILGTMKHLRTQLSSMKENAFAVSVNRYLQRRHADELRGLKGEQFDDKFRRIRQTYLFEKQN